MVIHSKSLRKLFLFALFQVEPPAGGRSVFSGIPRGQHRASRRRVRPLPVGVRLSAGGPVFGAGRVRSLWGNAPGVRGGLQGGVSVLAAFRCTPCAHGECEWGVCLALAVFLLNNNSNEEL